MCVCVTETYGQQGKLTGQQGELTQNALISGR